MPSPTSGLPWPTRAGRVRSQIAVETEIETGDPADPEGGHRPFLSFLVKTLAEDKRFELLRVSPTRFPSVRPRPLGESSAGQLTGKSGAPRTATRTVTPQPGIRDEDGVPGARSG